MKLEYQYMIFRLSMLKHYAGSPQELVHEKTPQTCGLQNERLFFFWGGGG